MTDMGYAQWRRARHEGGTLEMAGGGAGGYWAKGGHGAEGGVNCVFRILPPGLLPPALPLPPPPRVSPSRGPLEEEPWEVVPPPAGAAAGSRGRREAAGAMLGSGAKATKPSFVSYISPEVRSR